MSNVINIDGSQYVESVKKTMRWYQDNYGDLWSVAWMNDQSYNDADPRVDEILESKQIAMDL